MLEKIYTIPVNEAFDACGDGGEQSCPFCHLHKKLEAVELGLILGASMMEPDVHIKTNESGFCNKHYEKMLTMKNRLGLALMLESHLNKLREETKPSGIMGMPRHGAAAERIAKLEGSCYVCGRIEQKFGKMAENAVLLWEEEAEFRVKLRKQPYICLPHFKMFAETGKRLLGKKQYGDFYGELCDVTFTYFDELRCDVSHFCKKFDYRYDDEPWGNAKDAPERAIKFLGGDRS